MHRGVKWVVLDGPFTAGVQKEDLHLGNWYFLWAGRLHFIGSLLPCLCERRAEAMTWLGLLVDAVLGPRVSAFPVPCFYQKNFGYYNYCPNVGVIEESRFKSSERGNRSLPKLDVYVRLLPHEHGNRVFFFGGGGVHLLVWSFYFYSYLLIYFSPQNIRSDMCLSAFGALYFKIITLWLDLADLEYAKMKENSHSTFEMPLWEQNLNLKHWEQMILEFPNYHLHCLWLVASLR